jgi:hypothetical protein
MLNIKNNSMAMVATIALVGVIASVIGLFDPSTCVETQANDWTSCANIARDRQIGFWALLIVSVLGFAVSITRKSKKSN